MKYVGIAFRLGGYLMRNLIWIHRWSKHKNKHSLEERYQRLSKVILRVNKGLHMDFHVEGVENILTDTPMIMIPNHQSMVDPLLLFPYVQTPMAFIAKKEAEKIGPVRDAMNLLDSYFLERDNLRQELKVIRSVIQSLKEGNTSWVIFAEGHRTKNPDYEMNDFKPGTFKIAIDSHRPIVPIALYGGFRVLSKKYRLKKYPVQVHFLKPIYYEEYQGMKTFEIAKMVEDRVRNEVEILRKNDEEYMQELKKKKHKKEKKEKVTN